MSYRQTLKFVLHCNIIVLNYIYIECIHSLFVSICDIYIYIIIIINDVLKYIL